MGMAMGVFVGVTPTIPFHTALLVALGLVSRQNITSAYVGSWIISNPLTIPVFYITEYQIGRDLLGLNGSPPVLTDYSMSGMLNFGWDITLPLLTGGIILAPLFAVPAYFITRRLFTLSHKRKRVHVDVA